MERIFKITSQTSKKWGATDVVKWAYCGGVEVTATDITKQFEVANKDEKIFKLNLPENQDCRAEIVVAWAKLDNKSITASDITSITGPKGQQTAKAKVTPEGTYEKSKVKD